MNDLTSFMEELQNTVKIEDKSASSNKPRENSVKCSCIEPLSENGHSSDTESVKSDSESVSSDSGSSVSFVIVSDSSSATNRICCLKQRFGSIFLSTDCSDVSFIVGIGEQKQKIPAHRLVLSVGSGIFKTMFNKDWSSESTEIEVPDIEAPSFIALLRFLYMDEVELTSDTVTGILYAARKYAVKPLENQCVNFLNENLCPDNALTILNEARLLDIQKLVDSCLETIDKDTDAAVSADGFCDINIDTLCLVLDRDTLTVSEVRLFEAILRWSEAECTRNNLLVNQENQQLVLRQALPLIRFPLMSIEEFSSKVALSGLFTSEELVSVYQYFTLNPKPIIKFNDTPRFYKELTVNRFQKLENIVPLQNLGNSIDFICDNDVQLLGYGLSSSTRPAKYGVTIQLKDALTNDLLCNESMDVKCDGVTVIYKALFKKPIKLTALTKYTARVVIQGPDCFAGSEGLETVAVTLPHGRTITVTFSTRITEQCPTPFTTVDQGLIPQLILSA